MKPSWMNQVTSVFGFVYVDRLQRRNRLKQRRLPRAIVAEDHRPLSRATVTVGEVERLRFAEAADVFDGDREEIGRRRRGCAVLFRRGLFFLTLAHDVAVTADCSDSETLSIIQFLISEIPDTYHPLP